MKAGPSSENKALDYIIKNRFIQDSFWKLEENGIKR